MAIKIPGSKKNKKKLSENDPGLDLGFGEKFEAGYSRLLNHDGSFNIQRVGPSPINIYKHLINMPWWKFFGYFILLYISINIVFAFLYSFGGNSCIENLDKTGFFPRLEQLFYFSIQTFTTVGYGKLNPVSSYANIVATINAFCGLMYFALATGMFFSKFSTPVNHIKYSRNLIIAPYAGKKALMMRMVNTLDNHILNLEARITMSWIKEIDGVHRRKFAYLPLEINSIYMFPLNWTLIHVIDRKSPLFDKNMTDLKEANAEFIIQIHGYDRTYSKKIHSNRSYIHKDLIYGAVFNPMYEMKNEKTILHLDKIDDITRYKFIEDQENKEGN